MIRSKRFFKRLRINLSDLKKVTSLITATLLFFTPLMTRIGSAETPTKSQALDNPEEIALVVARYNEQCLTFRMDDMVNNVLPTIPGGPYSQEFQVEAAIIWLVNNYIAKASEDPLVQKAASENLQQLDGMNLVEALKDIKVNCVVTSKGMLQETINFSPIEKETAYTMIWNQIILDTDKLLASIVEHLNEEQLLFLAPNLMTLEESGAVILEEALRAPQSLNRPHDSLMKTVRFATDLLSALIERPAFAQIRERQLEDALRGNKRPTPRDSLVSVAVLAGLVALPFAVAAVTTTAAGGTVATGAGGVGTAAVTPQGRAVATSALNVVTSAINRASGALRQTANALKNSLSGRLPPDVQRALERLRELEEIERELAIKVPRTQEIAREITLNGERILRRFESVKRGGGIIGAAAAGAGTAGTAGTASAAPAGERPFFERPAGGGGTPPPDGKSVEGPAPVPAPVERTVTIETVNPDGTVTRRTVTVKPGETIDDTDQPPKEEKPKEDQPKEEQAKEEAPPPPPPEEKPEAASGTQDPNAPTAQEIQDRAKTDFLRSIAERKLGPQAPVGTTSKAAGGNIILTNPDGSGVVLGTEQKRGGTFVDPPADRDGGGGGAPGATSTQSGINLGNVINPGEGSGSERSRFDAQINDARAGLDEAKGRTPVEDVSGSSNTSTAPVSPTPSTTADKIAPSTSTTTTTTTTKTTISPDQTVVAVAPTTKETATFPFLSKDTLTRDQAINLSISKCAANYQAIEVSALQNNTGLPEVCRSCLTADASGVSTDTLGAPTGSSTCKAYICRFQPACSFGLVLAPTSTNTQYSCIAPPPTNCHEEQVRVGLETAPRTITVCDDFTAAEAAFVELNRNTDSVLKVTFTPNAGSPPLCQDGYRFGNGSITDSHNYQYSCIAEQAQNPCIGTTLVGSAELNSCCAF